MKTKTVTFLIISILFIGCKKEKSAENQQLVNGIYIGAFSSIESSDTKTATTTITLDNGKFSCNGSINGVLNVGSGVFSYNDKIINFIDMNFRTQEYVYTLLSGEYNYIFDGKNLKISHYNNSAYHEYNLVKQ